MRHLLPLLLVLSCFAGTIPPSQQQQFFVDASPPAAVVGAWPSDNLQVDLKLDNDTTDSSGNANNFTYHGSGATYTPDEVGTANKALQFNGTDEYIDAPDTVVGNFTTGDFTIAICMTNTISDFSSSPLILGNTTFGAPGYYLIEHYAFGGNLLAAELQFEFNDDVGGHDHAVSSIDRIILPNVNYWIVVVRSGSSISIYVNGTDVTQPAQPTVGNINASSSKFTIGKYLGNSNYLPAKVQRFKMWTRALTPTEIVTGSAANSQQ